MMSARQSKSQQGGYPHGEARDGEMVAEFVYKDKNGKPYLKVEKWVKMTAAGERRKGYPQYNFVKGTPGEDSSWKPGAPKGPKIPYNLPSLIKAKTDEPVFIAEGEMKADDLIDLDLVATTCSGGATKGSWTSDLNKWFKNRKVIYILEDNNAPGYRHAKSVAEALVDVVDKNAIHVVRFRDLQIGKDVSDWLNDIGGDNDAKLKALMERCVGAPVYCRKPVIEVKAGQLHEMTKQTMDALVAARLPNGSELPIVARAGRLMMPIYSSYRAATRNGIKRKTQTTMLRYITETNLSELATKYACEYVRYMVKETKTEGIKTTIVASDPPAKMLTMLLDRGHWGFPEVSGCIDAPTLRPNGTLLDQPGFDEVTGLWYYKDKTGEIKLPKLPTKPTKDDAVKALKKFKELFKEVRFAEVRRNLNLSVALAATLTAALRGAFDTAPLFFVTSPTSGTGKSYLVDLISNIVHGKDCPATFLSGSQEERHKQIGAVLLEGVPIISLDNLEKDLSDPVLCQMITQSTVKIRVLGTSDSIPCEWRGTLFATGNNIQVVGDMVRRSMVCRLDAGEENPEEIEFSEPDPISRVLENRGEYIAAALTIALAYLNDKNAVDKKFSGFPGWSKFVRSPLIWLGEEDPVQSQVEARKEDPKRNAGKRFVYEWNKLFKDAPYKVHELVTLANKGNGNGENFGADPAYTDFYEILLELAGNHRGTAIEPTKLGHWLKAIRDKVYDVDDGVDEEGKKVGKRRLRVIAWSANSATGNKWKVEVVKGVSQDKGGF